MCHSLTDPSLSPYSPCPHLYFSFQYEKCNLKVSMSHSFIYLLTHTLAHLFLSLHLFFFPFFNIFFAQGDKCDLKLSMSDNRFGSSILSNKYAPGLILAHGTLGTTSTSIFCSRDGGWTWTMVCKFVVLFLFFFFLSNF